MTAVAEVTVTFTDADVEEERESKNLESEHEQLVTLVALYRKHLEEQQKDHSHSSNVRDYLIVY
jgi:hypothetical protein